MKTVKGYLVVISLALMSSAVLADNNASADKLTEKGAVKANNFAPSFDYLNASGINPCGNASQCPGRFGPKKEGMMIEAKESLSATDMSKVVEQNH